MNTSRQNNYAPFPLFLTAALFILASPVFWTGVEAPGQDRPGLVQENKDLYLEIAPTMHYGFSRLRTGELPLWNDRQLCGTPFFANPIHGLLQPLNAGFLFLDTPRALALHAFVALTLMGFFFVLFMRSLGVLYIPAALGGIVYMCCGASAAAMSRPGIANALVWMPMLCWTLSAFVREPRLVTLFGGSAILSLLWLAGSPLMALVATGFSSAYACCFLLFDASIAASRTSHFENGVRSRLGGMLLMLLIAFALTCIQWLPTLVWAMRLNSPGAFLGSFSVAGVMPANQRTLLEQLLQARSGVLPALGYIGVATLLLIPAAFLHGIPRWQRAFFATASIALWISTVLFGSGAPEGFWATLIYLATFSIATLAALGADRLFAPRRNTASPRLWGPLALVAVTFAILFVLAPAETRGRTLPLAVSLVIFGVFRTRWASALSGVILILLLFVDLNAASVNYHGHPFFDGAAGFTLPEETHALLKKTALDDRIMISGSPTEGVHENIGMSTGFRVANGTGQPLTSGQIQWWNALQGESADASNTLDVSADTPHALLLNIMATRAVVATDTGGLVGGSAPGLRLRRKGEVGNVVVYENENAIPRLSWASSWRMVLDMPSVFEALGDKSFNPRRECVILTDEPAISHLARTVPDTSAQLKSETTETRITTLLDAPEHLVVEVENAIPGILVLSDTYAPGWRATVNGQRAPILKANGLFRGIALGPGSHTISFEYRPLSIIAGAIISVVTLVLLVLVSMLHLLNRMRKTKTA